MSWFPLLLAIHIVLAVAMLVPSVVLPFVLRAGDRPQGGVARALMGLQGTGTLVIGAGLALTGAAMLWTLGPELLTQPWLLTAIALYAINLAVAAFISRPNLRRLVGIGSGSEQADETWRRRARRQRWVAYGMAAAIGVIGLLMSTKPALW